MAAENIFLKAPKNVSDPLSLDQFLKLITESDGNSAATALGTRTDDIIKAIVWRLSQWKFFKKGNLLSMNSRDYLTENETPFKAKDAVYYDVIDALEITLDRITKFKKNKTILESKANELTQTPGGHTQALKILNDLEINRADGVKLLIACADNEQAGANHLKTLQGGRRGRSRSSRKLKLSKVKKSSRYYSRRA